ncbi:Pollen Ole e I family allergen [Quillaja saponaria]|uniref:Pollen Ole e I family allergen n=1 Tax=Quillaja saponaria TaxID=32244 RepID=A0AAD7Q0J8_QUISA|nr:Pollen Ole e I family allergen [Quillaja saponaria]
MVCLKRSLFENEISVSQIPNTAKKMERKKLSRLGLVLSLLFFTASETAAAQNKLPGFLFTRTRGRCTPQFWSKRREEWPRMVPHTSTVSKVFGSRAFERYRSDLTLLEATARIDKQSPFSKLLKQASAALLNSYARDKFPYSPWQVKTLVIQGLVSEESAILVAKRFSIANQACN